MDKEKARRISMYLQYLAFVIEKDAETHERKRGKRSKVRSPRGNHQTLEGESIDASGPVVGTLPECD